MLPANQVTVSFVHQYLWKESINLLDCLHVDKQRKAASETTTFDWVWSVVHLVQSDCRILWSSISLEGINRYLSFFCVEIINKEREHLKLPLLVGFCQLCLFSNQIEDSVIIHYLWKKSICNVIGFFLGNAHQANVVSATTSLVWCGQLYPSSNQIAGFFDH